jgi:hypothetical protein
MIGPRARLACAGLLLLAGCDRDTSKLSPELTARFAAEGIRYRADNTVFRWSHDVGTSSAGWENRDASIIVTGTTVFIHKNEKVGVEITPTASSRSEVHRDHDRIRISVGSGAAKETWSFTPPADAPGWTDAIRAVIRAKGDESQ